MLIPALVPRDRFPIVTHCCYLASHSLGAMPRGVPDALQAYCRSWAEQGILAWNDGWWESIAEFSTAVEALLDASAETVVPCLNVTLGFAAIASCFEYGRRPKIVISDLEFTTTLPFWLGQQRLGAKVVVCPAEAMEAAIDERTVLAVSSHAFFRSGALQDVASLQAHCRRVGAKLVVDGYQSIGAVPFSVREVDPDFLVGGCHKWLCGGPGGGYLYVRPELSAALIPRLTGWFGLAEPFDYRQGEAPIHPGVRRFLTGTPNVLGLFAAQAGLQTVREVGISAIRAHSHQLTAQLIEGAQARGFTIRTPLAPQERNGMVCLDFEGARQTQQRLEQAQVIVDWRPDCGMRISPHFYNDSGDIERFFAVLDEILPRLILLS